MNLVKPKKRKINDKERIPVPYVKCCICGDKTTRGLHQVRLVSIESAKKLKNKRTGEIKIKPPIMKQKHLYMCIKCVEKGKVWPGKKS